MMRKSGRIFTLVLVAIFWETAASQNFEGFIASQAFYNRLQDRQFDLSFRRAGAEFLGMGGASLATAQTPAAALWNPAGLTALARVHLAMSGSFNLNTREITVQQFAGMKVISEIDPNLFPTFASLYYPLRAGARTATVGVAYHQPQNFSQANTNTLYFYPSGSADQVENPAGHLHAFVPSLAFTLWPRVSLGLSYNYLRGSSQYEFKIQSPFADETVFFAFEDEESYEGAFAVVGLQARPADWLALGATMIPPWTYTITEKSETILTPRNVSGASVAFDTLTTPAADLGKYELEIPFSYEVGVALRPTAKLLLAFDFAARPWSEINAPVPLDLSDCHSFRVGLEYLSQTKWAQFPLRLGYYTKPSPYRDQYFQGQYYGKQIEGGVFTLGLGVLRRGWSFHFAYETGEREYSWWLDEGDYYNERISSTAERFNEITFSVSYQMGKP